MASKKRHPSTCQRATAHGATTTPNSAAATPSGSHRARGFSRLRRQLPSSTPAMMIAGIRMPMPLTMNTSPTTTPSHTRRQG